MFVFMAEYACEFGMLCIGRAQSVVDSLVAGRIYVNFHTSRNPDGRVRGDVVVDPAKGQYGISSLAASSFDAGRKYIVVAVGSGKSLQLLKYSERQAGLTKQNGIMEANKK